MWRFFFNRILKSNLERIDLLHTEPTNVPHPIFTMMFSVTQSVTRHTMRSKLEMKGTGQGVQMRQWNPKDDNS